MSELYNSKNHSLNNKMKLFFCTSILAILATLFVSLIFFVESSVISHNDDDACARISAEYKKSNQDPEFSANYSDLKACFESFPYDRNIAENVKSIY